MKKMNLGFEADAEQLNWLQHLYFLLLLACTGEEGPLPVKQLFIVTFNTLIHNFSALDADTQTSLTASSLPVLLNLFFRAKPDESYQAIQPQQAPSLPQPMRVFLKESDNLVLEVISYKAETKAVPSAVIQRLGEQAVAALIADDAKPKAHFFQNELQSTLRNINPLEDLKNQTGFRQQALNILQNPQANLALNDMRKMKEQLVAAMQTSPNAVLKLCGQSPQNLVLAATGWGWLSSISNWWNQTAIAATQLIFKMILLIDLSQDTEFLIRENLQEPLLAAINEIQQAIKTFLTNHSAGNFPSASILAIFNTLSAMSQQLQVVANDLQIQEEDGDTAVTMTAGNTEEEELDEDRDCDEEVNSESAPLVANDFVTKPSPQLKPAPLSQTPWLNPVLQTAPINPVVTMLTPELPPRFANPTTETPKKRKLLADSKDHSKAPIKRPKLVELDVVEPPISTTTAPQLIVQPATQQASPQRKLEGNANRPAEKAKLAKPEEPIVAADFETKHLSKPKPKNAPIVIYVPSSQLARLKVLQSRPKPAAVVPRVLPPVTALTPKLPPKSAVSAKPATESAKQSKFVVDSSKPPIKILRRVGFDVAEPTTTLIPVPQLTPKPAKPNQAQRDLNAVANLKHSGVFRAGTPSLANPGTRAPALRVKPAGLSA